MSKFTDKHIMAMKVACHLLPVPAPEVIIECLEEIERLRWELKVIRAVAGNKANDKADKAVIIGLVNDALKGGGDE